MADNNNYDNIVTVKFAQAEQPKFTEKKGTEPYIEFGEKNNYPDYLLSLYNESPKHGAIIKGKANYIFGKGLDSVPVKANIVGESWNSILKKCIIDDEIFSGYYLQVIYNLLGKIKDVYHLEFYKVRTTKAMNKFYVKNDWTDNKEKARPYPAFDGKYDPEQPTKIFYVQQYNPKANVYPLPSYFQGLNYIDSDVQVSRHILGNAKHGFSATTLISLNNGEPTEEAKEQVEKGLKKKLTGSEGDRIVITFNKSKENSAEITPLSNTMLTKEDFTNINNLIQQEIFASHQVTSPILFGIKTEGQLGGRTEMQEAYEIFNNTYVNERQQAHEEVFNQLLLLAGVNGTFSIIPVEPLGFTLKEDLLLDVMPREYFMDKLAVDQKYYSLPPARSNGAAPAATGATDASGNVMAVNENLKSMTGKQFQGMQRIVKKFKKGDITRDQAAMLLKNSFGISDEEIALFLDDSTQQFASQEEIDFELVNQFGQFGEAVELFEEISRVPAKDQVNFAETIELTQLESDVLNLIRKDKRITPQVIATTLKKESAYINDVMARMVQDGVLTQVTTTIGQDTVIERTATDIKLQKPPASTTDILLRYRYDGPKDERNRPFCARMMELARLYSRADIETISDRLGYSVWDRRGGWLTLPSGEHRPSCRHTWFAVTVKRKS